jgi:hypothetical protein
LVTIPPLLFGLRRDTHEGYLSIEGFLLPSLGQSLDKKCELHINKQMVSRFMWQARSSFGGPLFFSKGAYLVCHRGS